MAIEHLKSTFVTNADATPAVANTAAEGGPGVTKVIEGSVVISAAATIDSTYQLCRVPSNCKVKKIFLETATQAAGAGDLGLYFATDGQGGRPTSLLASQAIDQDFFASAVTLTTLTSSNEVTNESGTYTIDKRTQPLWQAVGLTVDPGGNFDICLTITTNVTTGTGRLGIEVMYTD